VLGQGSERLRASPAPVAAVTPVHLPGVTEHPGHQGQRITLSSGAYRIEDESGEPTGGVVLASPPFDRASLLPSKTEVLLAIDIPEQEIQAWEWQAPRPKGVSDREWENRPREFFVPARIVNRYGPPVVVDDDDAEE